VRSATLLGIPAPPPGLTMKCPVFVALLFAFALTLSAADSANSKTQTGRLSTATLLATQRISGKGAPDGIRFLFLVTRKPDVTGQFTLKETRDFLIAGESYQEKTQAELGKKIEPGTVFDSAKGFFAKQPGARHLAPPDIEGAYVLTIAIGGAKIAADAKGEIALHVGFDKEIEPFTFRFAAPPNRANPSK
jgi:hypothetical protein